MFTAFVSVTTNYSRCFSIKDHILDEITKANGVNNTSVPKINTYLKSLGYTTTRPCPDDGSCWLAFSSSNDYQSISGYGSDTDANYCIQRVTINARGSDHVAIDKRGYVSSAYYKVAVFFSVDWPILTYFININITGETQTILNNRDFSEFDYGRCSAYGHG